MCRSTVDTQDNITCVEGDKIFLKYILEESYKRCKKKKGAPGVDGISFTDIEK